MILGVALFFFCYRDPEVIQSCVFVIYLSILRILLSFCKGLNLSFSFSSRILTKDGTISDLFFFANRGHNFMSLLSEENSPSTIQHTVFREVNPKTGKALSRCHVRTLRQFDYLRKNSETFKSCVIFTSYKWLRHHERNTCFNRLGKYLVLIGLHQLIFCEKKSIKGLDIPFKLIGSRWEHVEYLCFETIYMLDSDYWLLRLNQYELLSCVGSDWLVFK